MNHKHSDRMLALYKHIGNLKLEEMLRSKQVPKGSSITSSYMIIC